MQVIGLDFETYGAVSLPDHGLDRYVDDPSFTPLIAHTYYSRGNSEFPADYDFVLSPYEIERDLLFSFLEDKIIVAQNSGFEQRVLKWMGWEFADDDSRFIDSATVARVAGAGGSLQQAAPQLLGVQKMKEGREYIKLFSIPGKYQEANGSPIFDPDVAHHNPTEWAGNHKYCGLDAELSYKLWLEWSYHMGMNEQRYNELTNRMNREGWHVDMAAVELMQQRFEENKKLALHQFYETMYPDDVLAGDKLNFNSFPQLKEFCQVRGVKAKSFDADHVAVLMTKVQDRLANTSLNLTLDQRMNLSEVHQMLHTKQILGGSSLSKLQKIKDLVGNDGILRDSYVHTGAAATLRTSGRGVQMQNLKRLQTIADMSTLDDEGTSWDNEALAENLRQCFTSRHPKGLLIVGDFASIESRGLAYLAGAEWKLKAYREDKDLYKVLAQEIYNIGYDDVLKPQRQTGKVGELSCGYGAGGQAVKDFAAKMGVEFTLAEATELVNNWRGVNPEAVNFWDLLNTLLHDCLNTGMTKTQKIGNGMTIQFFPTTTPKALKSLHPNAQSVVMSLLDADDGVYLTRVFHGCYFRGKDVCYYKPASNKGGDVWVNHYRHPKTHEIVFYKLYGGKLAGTLTQSMCREIFFRSLSILDASITPFSNCQIVGQFHDEIVVDWQPPENERSRDWRTRMGVIRSMENAMTNVGPLGGFPLAADIKSDYRYIK